MYCSSFSLLYTHGAHTHAVLFVGPVFILAEKICWYSTPSTGKTGSAGYLPVDKTLPRSEGLYKKHKNWRETEVVNFWYSSSEETCSN
jgi:hypothetical protein